MAPRIAVLGCGYWGGNHIRTLKSLGALQAVSDAKAEQAERFAAEFNVPNIPVDELFTRPDIDGIVPFTIRHPGSEERQGRTGRKADRARHSGCGSRSRGRP